IERPRLVQGPLRAPGVEFDPRPRPRLADPAEAQPQRRVVHIPGARTKPAASPSAARLRAGASTPGWVNYPFADLGHVIALVAAGRDVVAGDPGRDRGPEEVDLRPGVVEVVLALDVVACEREHPRQRVPVGEVAAARHRQRAGWIGADELDE